ncbi:SHOCT domain-containing protein [Microbacterium marinum]|uniref:SHOCT domain-containing protein n=1 Tax=Microbacterium marinum TaxID=421115 RepID=UPI00385113DD
MTMLWGEFIPTDEIPFDDTGVGPFYDNGMATAQNGFGALFGLVVVVAIAGVIFSAVVGMRKYRVLNDAGVAPLTVDAAIAAKVLRSDVLAPAAPTVTPTPETKLEERLAELDDLHARGVISDDEHRDARSAALRG